MYSFSSMKFTRGVRLLQDCLSNRGWSVRALSFCTKLVQHNRKICFPLLLATPLAAVKENDENEKLKAPDPRTLTNSYLIKNACTSSVDSVSALFYQTVVALLQAEQEYAEAVYTLISLLEFHLTSLNFEEKEQNKIWDLIISQKQVVKEKKESKQELELLFQSVESVMNDLAQASFLAGADVSGIRIGEEMFSVQSHLRQAKQVSVEAETKLTETDVKVIQVTSEHEEKSTDQSDTSTPLTKEDSSSEADN